MSADESTFVSFICRSHGWRQAPTGDAVLLVVAGAPVDGDCWQVLTICPGDPTMNGGRPHPVRCKVPAADVADLLMAGVKVDPTSAPWARLFQHAAEHLREAGQRPAGVPGRGRAVVLPDAARRPDEADDAARSLDPISEQEVTDFLDHLNNGKRFAAYVARMVPGGRAGIVAEITAAREVRAAIADARRRLGLEGS